MLWINMSNMCTLRDPVRHLNRNWVCKARANYSPLNSRRIRTTFRAAAKLYFPGFGVPFGRGHRESSFFSLLLLAVSQTTPAGQ
jgi:hypothetical protein